MSEEIKVCYSCYYIPKYDSLADVLFQDAGRTVPTAMVGSYLLSGVLSVIFLISYLFVIVDIEGAVDHPTGYPFLFVFTQAFSMEAVNALTSIVICLIFAGTLSYNLSSSRQVWAVSFVHGIDDRPMLMICSSLAMKVCHSLAGLRRLIPHLRCYPNANGVLESGELRSTLVRYCTPPSHSSGPSGRTRSASQLRTSTGRVSCSSPLL
jgi:hypothetical protein